MITRRQALTTLSLSAMAIGTAPLLSGCAAGQTTGGLRPEPRSPGRVGLVSSNVARKSGSTKDLPLAVGALHALGAGVYGDLASVAGENAPNLALSPYSIGIALALTANGAGGQTRNEMLDVLSVPDLGRLNGGLNALSSHVDGLAGSRRRADRSKAEIVLDTANTLFGDEATTFEPAFLDTLARHYDAGMRTVDYRTAPEPARLAINGWVAEQTRDQITDLLPEGMIDALTRLVLVNALYLKAPWERPFEPDLTEDGDFTLRDGSTVSVAMMNSVGEEGPSLLGRGEGWQTTQLPYAGGELAMTIVLPDPDRFTEVEAAIAAGELPNILASLSQESVALTLPRWTFRTQTPLMTTLKAMGMERAFDRNQAEFSAITRQEQLFISAVQHEVFIAVDEQGTEAAAATAVVVRAQSAPLTTPLVVDRPFLFAIHDVQHGTPLFLGRVTDPST